MFALRNHAFRRSTCGLSISCPAIKKYPRRSITTGPLEVQRGEEENKKTNTFSIRKTLNSTTIAPNCPKYKPITIRDLNYHPVLLRDACPCPECVDPSTTQKNFRTTDFAFAGATYLHESLDVGPTDTKITWRDGHISTFPNNLLEHHHHPTSLKRDDSAIPGWRRKWNSSIIKHNLRFFDYQDYMTSEETLHQALQSLGRVGLVILRGIPSSEKSVEDIAGRIGTIRDTFYGRTWDVKSVPEAKNVAYTSRYLGLHMDLLYMANPPGFQLLHCLKNTAQGGDSLFSDCFFSASLLDDKQRNVLSSVPVAYHYKNAGEHYHYCHPVIELHKDPSTSYIANIRHFNYSPPFQAPYALRGSDREDGVVSRFLDALSAFASLVENPLNMFSYRLKEGECVLFNNRRILHGRQSFDAEGGERWLKGTYIDTDVVASKMRVMNAKYPTAINNSQDTRNSSTVETPGN